MHKKFFRKPSPAMVIACMALFVALGGASYAAISIPNNSVGTAQLKANAVISSKVKNHSLKAVDFAQGQLPKGAKGDTGAQGLTGTAGVKGDTGAAGAQGLTGAKGDIGATGAAGAQGASGVVTTGAFSGQVTTLVASSLYVFAGGPATITTTASQRLTGAAEVPLSSTLASASGQYFDYGLCYEPNAGGTISNFAGTTNYSTGAVYPTLQTFAAAASVVPGVGTWKVGFCVRNGGTGAHPIDMNDIVNGWVQVTN